jgi:hypothetical protein
MKKLIRKVLKEETLVNSLLDQIQNDGWRETAELVGGPKNLLKILGDSKENVIKLLMSYFNDLRIQKRGGNLLLMDKGYPLIETSSWGLSSRAYNSYIESRFDDNIIDLYREYRRDFIRLLVSLFPELNTDEIDVYEDSGLYRKLDTFHL